MDTTPHTDGRGADVLRDVRLALLDRLDELRSAQDVFDFQRKLLDEIQTAERVIAYDTNSHEFGHRHLVRRFGDALAWCLLHPYAIRNLWNPAAGPPSISNQRGFETTVRTARERCEQGVPAIIADLTYCLGVGDVIAVTDPERPVIIECGGNPERLNKGRKGRQMRRALAISTLLHRRQAELLNDGWITRTIQIDTPTTHIFGAVERAILAALRKGRCAVTANEAQIVVAVRHDHLPTAKVEIGKAREHFVHPVVHLVTIHDRRPNARVRPPHVWPIGAEGRRAVIESDVLVLHIVDMARLVGRKGHGARLVAIDERRDGLWIRGERGDEAFELAPGMVGEFLGAFETIDSAAERMLAFVAAVAREQASSDPPEPRQANSPRLIRVDSLNQADRLAAEPAMDTSSNDIVMMPLHLYEQLAERRLSAPSSLAPKDEPDSR